MRAVFGKLGGVRGGSMRDARLMEYLIALGTLVFAAGVATVIFLSLPPA